MPLVRRPRAVPEGFRLSLGFAEGLRASLAGLADLASEPPLRRWYVRSVLKTFLVALFVFALLAGTAVWGFAGYFEETWASAVGIVLFLVLLAFFSGSITFSLMNLSQGLLFDEKNLLRALAVPVANVRVPWRIRALEVTHALATVAVALLCWPLLFFVVLMPLAVLACGWAMGREAFVSALKVRAFAEGGVDWELRTEITAGAALGVGILPALGILFPILGWALFPVLNYAAFRALETHRPRAQNSR